MLIGDSELTSKIIGAAIEAHKTLGGPGLREEVYKLALVWELKQLGLDVQTEVAVPIIYKGMNLSVPDHPLRIDILVEGRIVVECKSLSKNNPLFASQCLTYMRLGGYKTGLVINFGLQTIKEGLDRVYNKTASDNAGEANPKNSPLLRPPCFAVGVTGAWSLRGNTENGGTEK